MNSESPDASVEKLLVRLMKEKAFKGNAKRVWIDEGQPWQIEEAVGRRLVNLGYARNVPNGEAPARLHLELTESGIGAAKIIIASKTIKARLARINWLGWVTFFAALLGIFATIWTAKN